MEQQGSEVPYKNMFDIYPVSWMNHDETNVTEFKLCTSLSRFVRIFQKEPCKMLSVSLLFSCFFK